MATHNPQDIEDLCYTALSVNGTHMEPFVKLYKYDDDETRTYIAVKYFSPRNVEYKGYDAEIMEPLLAKAKQYCEANGLVLWSY